MATIDAADGGVGGFVWEGAVAGRTYIIGHAATGTGTLNNARWELGATDEAFTAVNPAQNANSLFAQAWYLHDSGAAGDLSYDFGDTGLSSHRDAGIAVSGLAHAAPADVAGNSNASGTAHSAGTVTLAGGGVVFAIYRTSGDPGTVTPAADFSTFTIAASAVAVYRAVTVGGNYTPSFTCTNSVSSEAQASAWADAGGAPPRRRTLQLLGIG